MLRSEPAAQCAQVTVGSCHYPVSCSIPKHTLDEALLYQHGCCMFSPSLPDLWGTTPAKNPCQHNAITECFVMMTCHYCAPFFTVITRGITMVQAAAKIN